MNTVAGLLEAGSDRGNEYFIGHPERAIIARFGQPTNEWDGHYGNPPDEYRRTFPEAI
jgi:hypothetical protein